MNRDLGRKSSTETVSSDRPHPGPEKTASTSDRSAAANVSEGDKLGNATERAGKKESLSSSSAERGVSRERPGSAGERHHGSDRERDRPPGSDRDRDLGSDRERDRASASGVHKAVADRDTEGERSGRTERKNSGSGSGGGRSVSLDKMTIAEKSAISRRPTDHQEKPNASSKEREEGSDKIGKSDRLLHLFSAFCQECCLYP